MFDYEPIDLPIAAAMPDGIAMLMRVPPFDDRAAAQGLERFLLWEEQQLADQLQGNQRTEFVCGRLALRTACRRLGANVGPILRSDRGAPHLPAELSGTIAHRKGWVLTAVDWARNGSLGVDVESWPPAPSIAKHVLTPQELADSEALPEEERARALLVHFAIKEALFKALDPHARRDLSFQEVVVRQQGGAYDLSLRLQQTDHPYQPVAFAQWWGDWVFASVRVRVVPQDCSATQCSRQAA